MDKKYFIKAKVHTEVTPDEAIKMLRELQNLSQNCLSDRSEISQPNLSALEREIINMQYPIFIHKDPESDYGVTVPDLPGCFSAGATLEEAITNAHEAIECHLEGLLLDSGPIPIKKNIEEHINNPDLQDGVLILLNYAIECSEVSGDPAELFEKLSASAPPTKRKRIMTIAEKLKQKGELDGVKKVARNLLRSGFDLKVVAKNTGLALTEIEAIQASLKK